MRKTHSESCLFVDAALSFGENNEVYETYDEIKVFLLWFFSLTARGWAFYRDIAEGSQTSREWKGGIEFHGVPDHKAFLTSHGIAFSSEITNVPFCAVTSALHGERSTKTYEYFRLLTSAWRTKSHQVITISNQEERGTVQKIYVTR